MLISLFRSTRALTNMQILIALLLAVMATASVIERHDERRLAMENPDLFQGDILGFEDGDRNVIPNQKMRWTNKVVPYVIHSSLANDTNLIQSAINDFQQNTCLRFKIRTNEKNFVKMFAGKGCYSNLGMIHGEQKLSLGKGCLHRGSIIHELGHTIGFFHEQNRSDRDKYLTIYWNNIEKGREKNFILLKPHENLLLTPFDHDSMMLYDNDAFSKDGKSHTMVAKNGKKLVHPAFKPGLSRSDIIRVNKMYNC